MYDVPLIGGWGQYFDRMIEAPAEVMTPSNVREYLGEDFDSTEVWTDRDGYYHIRVVTVSGQRCMIFKQGDSRWPPVAVHGEVK